MREEGRDPAHGGEAAKKRGATQRELQRLNRDWEANPTHSLTVEDYKCSLLPDLRGVSARAISRAIGVSVGYAGELRNGAVVPHPRHWQTLHAMVLTQPETSTPSTLKMKSRSS
jgi:hypothetical protein